MHIRGIGAVVVVGALVVPAAGLAARDVKPANGKFKGTPHYKVAGKKETGNLTIAVAKHKITGVEFIASIPPIDAAHSKGPACGAVNDYPTKGYKRSGTTSASGQFNYAFTKKSKGFSDKVTLVGHFTSTDHAVGVWRDQVVASAAKSHCDTGKIEFAVAHS